MGVASWEYGELEEVVAIPATCFSGAFALFDVSMSNGRYWITVALDTITPEHNVDEVDK